MPGLVNLENKFRAGDQIIVIYSSVLCGESIVLAPDDLETPQDMGGLYAGCVVYRAAEIRRLSQQAATPDDLRRYHAAKRLLAPYTALIRAAEEDALPPGVVGFAGQDTTAAEAVLNAREWIIWLTSEEGSKSGKGSLLPKFEDVLKTIQSWWQGQ